MPPPRIFVRVSLLTCCFLQIPALTSAQTSFAKGQIVLKRLLKVTKEQAEFWQQHAETRLSIYLGRCRSGDIVLRNIMKTEKGLTLSDEFELNHENLGRTFFKSEQKYDKNGLFQSAILNTSAPTNTGKMLNTEYRIERKQGQPRQFLWSKKTHNSKVTEKILRNVQLVFAMPLGLAMRLPHFALGFNQLSFNALDLCTGKSSRLQLQLNPKTEKPFRHSKVHSQTIQLQYNNSQWLLEMGPESKLLSIHSQRTSIFSMVGGLVSSERFESLPEPLDIQASDAKGTVILFFRGLARGQAAEITPLVDFKSLYSEALERRGQKDPEFKRLKPFKALLMAKLMNFSWLAKFNLSVNSTAMRLSDLQQKSEKTETVVTLPGGGQIRLRQLDSSSHENRTWKIIAFQPTPK